MKPTLKSAVLSFSFLIFLSLISHAEQVVFSEINYNPKGDKPEYILSLIHISEPTRPY